MRLSGGDVHARPEGSDPVRHRPDFDDAALGAGGPRSQAGSFAGFRPGSRPSSSRWCRGPLARANPRRSWRWRVAGRTFGAAAVIALLSVSRASGASPTRRFVSGRLRATLRRPRRGCARLERGGGRPLPPRRGDRPARTMAGLREDTLTAGAFAVQDAPFLRLSRRDGRSRTGREPVRPPWRAGLAEAAGSRWRAPVSAVSSRRGSVPSTPSTRPSSMRRAGAPARRSASTRPCGSRAGSARRSGSSPSRRRSPVRSNASFPAGG